MFLLRIKCIILFIREIFIFYYLGIVLSKYLVLDIIFKSFFVKFDFILEQLVWESIKGDNISFRDKKFVYVKK